MKTKIQLHSCRAKSTVWIILVLIFLSAGSFAQTSNFSGNWKLNPSLSKLQAQFSFAPQTLNINQEGNNLSIEKVTDMMGQTTTTSEKYTLDGKECRNTAFMDSQKVSTATWNENGRLLISSSTDFQGQALKSTEGYYLDGNGHLVIEYKSQSPMGDMTETYVYDKI